MGKNSSTPIDSPFYESFLDECEEFCRANQIAEGYFGRLAGSGSDMMDRLRKNKRVWPDTMAKARNFMANYKKPTRGRPKVKADG